MSADSIEKKILLRVPQGRIWRALTDYREFGDWFGVKLDRPFVPGATISGAIVGSKVNPEVAKAQKEHEGLRFEITIENIEPERLFSFRWHPYAIDRGVGLFRRTDHFDRFYARKSTRWCGVDRQRIRVRSDPACSSSKGVSGKRARLEHYD